MNVLIHPMLDRYRGWPVVLDSNLLLLYWCSTFDPTLVKTFKRLNHFTEFDIYFLNEILQGLGELRTTPHVMTEVSNLANDLASWRKLEWAEHISHEIKLVPEFHEPATIILAESESAKFGLTDAALIRLASDHVILTVDWDLSGFLMGRRLAGINFKQLRSGGSLP